MGQLVNITTRWRHQTVITEQEIKVNNLYQMAVKMKIMIYVYIRHGLPKYLNTQGSWNRTGWSWTLVKSTPYICRRVSGLRRDPADSTEDPTHPTEKQTPIPTQEFCAGSEIFEVTSNPHRTLGERVGVCFSVDMCRVFCGDCGVPT